MFFELYLMGFAVSVQSCNIIPVADADPMSEKMFFKEYAFCSSAVMLLYYGISRRQLLGASENSSTPERLRTL